MSSSFIKSQNVRPNGRKRDRLVWLAVTGALSVVVLVFTLSPPVLAQSQQAENQRLYTMFEQVFQFVQNNYVDPVSAKKLMDGALKGMFDSLGDPHSAYLTADQMRNLTDTTTGEFGGVGMYISKQTAPEGSNSDTPLYIDVVSPIEDTPAYKAGIMAGDLIVRIGDQSTKDLTVDEVVDKLRGAPGTMVTFTIRRGNNIEFPVTLERTMIEVPTVKQAMISGDIGYLRIIQFTPHTAERTQEAIKYFEDNNYKYMIIDLRNNPGGLLDGVVNTADEFFSGGLIVGTKGRVSSENATYDATPGQLVPYSIPIVVLVDGGTASAAEILSGAMKDRKRAYLIGQKTYGKGSVQQVRSVGTGGFRLTMALYYTPSGTFIDKKGIMPDKVVAEPDLTDAQQTAYSKLLNQNLVQQFVESNPRPTAQDISDFATSLSKQGIDLPENLIGRLVKNEVARVANNSEVYDLQYDTVLKDAVQMLQEGNVPPGQPGAPKLTSEPELPTPQPQ